MAYSTRVPMRVSEPITQRRPPGLGGILDQGHHVGIGGVTIFGTSPLHLSAFRMDEKVF